MSDPVQQMVKRLRKSSGKTASDAADMLERMSAELDALLTDNVDLEFELFDAFSAGFGHGRKAGQRDARREAQQ